MEPKFRTVEHYIHGDHGMVVVVPARIAARLSDLVDLHTLRVRVRDDSELRNVLLALHLAALDWRSAATGTSNPATPELAPRSEWLGTQQAATLLGVTDRAVRKAIVEKRLPASVVGHGYRIRREDVEHLRAERRSRAA